VVYKTTALPIELRQRRDRAYTSEIALASRKPFYADTKPTVTGMI